MSDQPSRRVRRSISRRADKLMSGLRGRPMAIPVDADSRTHAFVLVERAPPSIVDRRYVVPGLALLGVRMEGLSEVLQSIDREQARGRSPVEYPVILLIGEWIQVAWIDVMPLQRGGDA